MTVAYDSQSQKTKLSFCNKSQEDILFVSILTNSKKTRKKIGQYLNKKFWNAAEMLAAEYGFLATKISLKLA